MGRRRHAAAVSDGRQRPRHGLWDSGRAGLPADLLPVGRILLPVDRWAIGGTWTVDEAFRNVDETLALKEVNVTWCEKLTDETFRRLQHCKRLTRVGMKGCRVSSPVIHQCRESGLTLF